MSFDVESVNRFRIESSSDLVSGEGANISEMSAGLSRLELLVARVLQNSTVTADGVQAQEQIVELLGQLFRDVGIEEEVVRPAQPGRIRPDDRYELVEDS